MGYVNDRAEAQDLVQETFINVWKGLAKFREEAKLSTWIFKIATNNCLRQLEKSKRIQTTTFPADLAAFPEPEENARLTFLYKCISELEEIDKILISLKLEEVPQEEIAEITGMSLTNVRVRTHRIKTALTLKFRDHGEIE